MKTKRKTPDIRFRGFSDDWEQSKLGELTCIFDGTHQTPKYKESGIKFVSVENIPSLNSDKYISEEAFEKEYSNKYAEINDVLMTRIGDVGTTTVIETDEPLAYYVTLSLLKPKNIDPYFLSFAITAPYTQSNIWRRTLHIAFPKKINLGEIKDVEVKIPKLSEQIAIGEFLKELNNTITLHQRKLQQLQEVKRGMLLKIYCKRKSKLPELRFSDFKEKWISTELENLTTITTGKLDANAMCENGKYDFYTSGIKKYKIDTPAFKGPAITIAGNGATVGYMHLANGEFNAYQRTYVLREFSANREFLFYELNNILPRKIQEESRTGNIPYIVMDMLTKLSITIPIDIQEQLRIGSLFTKLDRMIELQEREIELLEQTKKGFLQKMFV